MRRVGFESEGQSGFEEKPVLKRICDKSDHLKKKMLTDYSSTTPLTGLSATKEYLASRCSSFKIKTKEKA